MYKVFDMHCDLLMKLYNDKNISFYSNDCHIDLEKLQKGAYLAQCFAIFINVKKTKKPYETCLEMIKCYKNNILKYNNKINFALNYDDIIKNYNHNLISSILTIEDIGMLEGKIENLLHVYNEGVRMISLTWNYQNEIASPSFNLDKTLIREDGLTKKGIEFVKKMEELGIIIDVSHASDKTVLDVLKYTTKPFVASHSNARKIKNHLRNLNDDLLQKLKTRNCVIGINFCPSFVADNDQMYIDDLVKHIVYLKDLIGINHIGIGTDFDGISGDLEIKNASEIQKLFKKLKENGFSDFEIEQISYRNVLNLFRR